MLQVQDKYTYIVFLPMLSYPRDCLFMHKYQFKCRWRLYSVAPYLRFNNVQLRVYARSALAITYGTTAFQLCFNSWVNRETICNNPSYSSPNHIYIARMQSVSSTNYVNGGFYRIIKVWGRKYSRVWVTARNELKYDNPKHIVFPPSPFSFRRVEDFQFCLSSNLIICYCLASLWCRQNKLHTCSNT